LAAHSFHKLLLSGIDTLQLFFLFAPDNAVVVIVRDVHYHRRLPFNYWYIKAPRIGLLRLPPELIVKIAAELPSAAMAALGLTCKELYGLLDCEIGDILLKGWSMVDSVVNDENGSSLVSRARAILLREHRDLLGLLQDDRLDQASDLERSIDPLFCSACLKVHPFHLFSEEQRTIPACKRVCLAAEAKVEICEHISVNFVELKRMRDAAIKKAVSDKE
jgi:hypothetical protein